MRIEQIEEDKAWFRIIRAQAMKLISCEMPLNIIVDTGED
jgi:hypothetical protein